MNYKLPFILLVGMIISLYSCEKKPFDYRNKVIGKYLFVTKRQEYNQGIPSLLLDTIYTEGTIEYGPNADEFLVKYAPNEEFVWKVKKEDLFKNDGVWYFSQDNGEIRMHFYLHIGGMGVAKNHTINGLRMHN